MQRTLTGQSARAPEPDVPVLFSHPVLSVEGFPVQTSTGEQTYVRLRMPDWCNVVAITKDRRLVLVRQHRWGIEESTLEIPGGVVDPGEDPLEASKRELREETGFAGGTWTALGAVTSNPAIQDNRTWMFLAEGVELCGAPERGPGEEGMTVETPALSSLPELLTSGDIDHALAVASLQRYLLQSVRAQES